MLFSFSVLWTKSGWVQDLDHFCNNRDISLKVCFNSPCVLMLSQCIYLSGQITSSSARFRWDLTIITLKITSEYNQHLSLILAEQWEQILIEFLQWKKKVWSDESFLTLHLYLDRFVFEEKRHLMFSVSWLILNMVLALQRDRQPSTVKH